MGTELMWHIKSGLRPGELDDLCRRIPTLKLVEVDAILNHVRRAPATSAVRPLLAVAETIPSSRTLMYALALARALTVAELRDREAVALGVIASIARHLERHADVMRSSQWDAARAGLVDVLRQYPGVEDLESARVLLIRARAAVESAIGSALEGRQLAGGDRPLAFLVEISSASSVSLVLRLLGHWERFRASLGSPSSELPALVAAISIVRRWGDRADQSALAAWLIGASADFPPDANFGPLLADTAKTLSVDPSVPEALRAQLARLWR